MTIRLGWDGNKTAADTKENLTFDLGDVALDAVAVQLDLEHHHLLEKGRESLSVADQRRQTVMRVAAPLEDY